MTWCRPLLLLVVSTTILSWPLGSAFAQEDRCDGVLLSRAYPEVDEQYERLRSGFSPAVTWSPGQETMLDDLQTCPGQAGRRATYFLAVASLIKGEFVRARSLMLILLDFPTSTPNLEEEKGQYQELDGWLRRHRLSYDSQSEEQERRLAEQREWDREAEVERARRREAERRAAADIAQEDRRVAEERRLAPPRKRTTARLSPRHKTGATLLAIGGSVAAAGIVLNVASYNSYYQPRVSQADYEKGRGVTAAGLTVGFGGIAVGVAGLITLANPRGLPDGLALAPGPVTTLSVEF